MTELNIPEWLFYVIYPGHHDKMDLTIREALVPAVQEAKQLPGITQWFFIRYIDLRGVHLRLRFLGDTDAINLLQRRVGAVLDRSLSTVAVAAPEPFRRLLRFPEVDVPAGSPGYELSLYEPEFEKYGGPEGVEIAEQLFEASSDLAIDALRAEASGMAGRAALGLALMRMAMEEGVPAEQHDAFSKHYMWSWLGGNGRGSDTLGDQLAQAAARRGAVARQQCEELSHDPAVKRRLDLYGEALRTAFRRAKEAELPVQASELCFHYIHMMNNRLGFLAPEEAYLAALASQF